MSKSQFDPIPLLAALDAIEFCALREAPYNQKGVERNIWRVDPDKKRRRSPIEWELSTDGKASWKGKVRHVVVTLTLRQRIRSEANNEFPAQDVVKRLAQRGYPFTFKREKGVTDKRTLIYDAVVKIGRRP